ncbi:cobalt transporter CbiM [Paenirhodobacter enshiensis]|uniref:Cobalamin biosynthesis protein CbiM n=1 Tax=Paenirhodobacter enshiensis TaxID=1105367 RepID=A0A086XS61_9RHOB|nr:cobalt transporter CbiM [Paenirhodobacter enshiensis]KFI24861.1 cobalamin biosynthesis protein CbiM [Paenirhodobacter enshiensis]
MAHIPDGILSAPVLIGGGIVAAAGVAMALRRLDDRAIVRTAILSAAFFTVSLISVPLGPTSVHLMLGGLMGIMLGWGAALAVLVGLALQAVMFGIGGVTTLGVNTLDIAGPGVVMGLLLGPAIRRATGTRRGVLAGVAGAGAVLGTGALVSLVLALSAPEYTPVARIVLATYVPLALVEAAITAAVVSFLARTEPAALEPSGAKR